MSTKPFAKIYYLENLDLEMHGHVHECNMFCSLMLGCYR